MAVRYLSDGNPDGTCVTQTVSDPFAVFGRTPTSQRASATLSSTLSVWALTGASYVANTSTTVSGLFGFNSTLAVQLLDGLQEIRATLSLYGIHAGGATQS
jgi:hypothetical protein